MIKERPILFSAPMVRALLAGSKTQTRRVAKLNDSGRVSRGGRQWHVDDPDAARACPYGEPGNRLWVRETWGRGATRIMYRAGCNPSYRLPEGRWSSSIHMPRWASRITLEITRVRIERLRSITDEDALAEGIYPTNTGLYPGSPRAAFRSLWNSLNAKCGHGWGKNPWVWVIEFKRVGGAMG